MDGNNSEASGNACCSFCGKSQREVLKLIAGPTAYICNECIALCNDIVGDTGADLSPGQNKPNEAICMFCLSDKEEVGLLIAGGVGYICDGCIHACYEFVQTAAGGTAQPKRGA